MCYRCLFRESIWEEMKLNEIVTYHNDLSDLPLRKFNSAELDLLMTICSKCKYKETALLTLNFCELRKLSSYDSKDNHRLAEDIRRTNKKLLELNIMLHDKENPGTTVQFALFTRFVTSEENQTLEVKVNEEFKYILNELTSNFTRFELEEFVTLKSSYAKACYRQLKRYRDTGFWKVSLDQFRKLMDIPVSYTLSDINKRVLLPIEEELSKVFKHFTIEKTHRKGRGNPVVGYEFYFDAEPKWEPVESNNKLNNGFICPNCGQPLIEKVINGNNCWCHANGWHSSAPCNAIFNSVAEIKGYKENYERKNEETNETHDANQEVSKKGFFKKLFG